MNVKDVVARFDKVILNNFVVRSNQFRFSAGQLTVPSLDEQRLSKLLYITRTLLILILNF